MNKTSIEYLDFTSNPIVGCDMSLPCAERCWARRMAHRLKSAGVRQYQDVVDREGRWTGKTAFNEAALTDLLKKRKPATVGLCFMADAFHESVPDEWLDRMLAVVALTPNVRYILPTKRAKRMRRYCSTEGRHMPLLDTIVRYHGAAKWEAPGWPLPNLALMLSASNQAELNARMDDFLATPAALRVLSLEPMLGTAYLNPILPCSCSLPIRPNHPRCLACGGAGNDMPHLGWVICGGESGPGARPMPPEGPRKVRDDCVAAGVPFTFKQWGAWAPCLTAGRLVPEQHAKCRRISITGRDVTRDVSLWVDSDAVMHPATEKAAGRLLDGKIWDQRPEGWG
jgi:protein gp37